MAFRVALLLVATVIGVEAVPAPTTHTVIQPASKPAGLAKEAPSQIPAKTVSPPIAGDNFEHYCASNQLYSLMTDAGETVAGHLAEVGPFSTGAVPMAVLIIVLLASVVVLFFGQKLAEVTLIIVAPLCAFAASFFLFHVWMRPSPHNCTPLPIILAVVVAVLSVVLIAVLRECKLLPQVTAAVYGGALGFVAMFLLREVIISAAPSVLAGFAIDYYWLASTIVTLLCGVISTMCVTSAGGKSIVLILASSVVGGYGVAQSIVGLTNLRAHSPIPSWAFIVCFVGFTLAGLLVQAFATGSDAEANREKTRKRLRGERPLAEAEQSADLKEGLQAA